MSWSEEAGSSSGEKKYKGVRRRKWGKWVSEIRVPGSRERLWLGSYATPEAAAVAHDMAVLLLHGPRSAGRLNFSDRINVAAAAWAGMSPRSVQRVASDFGMAIDAERAMQQSQEERAQGHRREAAIWSEGEYKMFHEESELGVGDYSIDDMEISNNSF